MSTVTADVKREFVLHYAFSVCPEIWLRALSTQLAVALVALCAIAAPEPGSIDPTFNTGRGPFLVTAGTGYGVVLQSDGKIVVGGAFNGIDLDPSNSIVRFNPDGSVDATFDSSSVQVDETAPVFYTKPLCIQGNGQIIVGGQFDTSDGAHHSLLRLNADGTLDNTFDPVLEPVTEGEPPLVSNGILQADGKLLISGGFVTVNGISRPSLARLNSNGTLDNSFVPASGGQFIALQSDGKILVGSYSGVVRLNSNGSVDSTFQADVSDVRSLLIQSDGKVIVSINTPLLEYITMRLNNDGSNDQSYLQQVGLAISLDSDHRAILSFGAFERLNTDGTIDSTFQADPNLACCVISIAEQPDQKLVLAGSGFIDQPWGIRRLLPDGQTDSTFPVSAGLTGIGNGSIDHAQLLLDGKILATGSFTHMDTLPRNNLARLNHDGTPDSDFDAGNLFAGGPARVLVPQPDGKVLVPSGDSLNDVVRLELTGDIDPTFDYMPPTFGIVNAIALQPDGKILVGCEDAFVRANPDGTLDPSFDAGLDAGRGVNQILLQLDGRILINGNYSSIHGIPAYGPMRLNSDGSLDENFDFAGGAFPSLLALQPDGKILFTYVNLFGFVGRVDPDGSSDESFNPVMTGATSAAVTQDGIYLGNRTVIRLRLDGTTDSSFAPVFPSNAQINQLLLQVDGQLIAAGSFAEVNGTPVNGIVRLNGTAPEKVANISTRALIGTGEAVEIGGFIITGTADKSVVIRAIGPSLPVIGSSLAGALANPRLELHDATGQLIAQNDNWRESQEPEIIASGLAPLNDSESAIATTLAPGAYTAVVQGAGGRAGIALVEIYDTSPASDSRLQNISTRGNVQTGDNVLIAGLILTGPESAAIVARAIGPSLSASDIADPLSDPTIEVHDQSGAIVASNHDWKDTQEAELLAAGLAPTNDKEAALIASLPPGPYTAIVRGADAATGIGLVEFYDTR